MGMVKNYDNDSQRAVHDLAHARIKITELGQTIQRERELSDALAGALNLLTPYLSQESREVWDTVYDALAQYTASRSGKV